MLVRLLGPIELEGADGQSIPIGGSKERCVLAVLAVHANQVLSESFLIDALWGDDPPRTAERTLQGYVSRVRKALSEAGADARTVLDSSAAGWALRVGPDSLDLADVERLVDAGRASVDQGDHVGAALAYADALRGWRGRPLGELAELPWATTEAARLEALRQHIVEERIEAELACGRHAQLVGELEALTRAHPLRERVWRLWMLSLYRSGRQAEALRAYQLLRDGLGEELGIEPSQELRGLEQAILDHDPALEWRPQDRSTGPTHLAELEAARAAPELPGSGIVTLVFTDIVGSTELTGRLGDEAYDRVRQAHFRLLRDEVAGAGGAEVKTLGDGVFAAFAEPDGALAAAIAIQQAVARRKRRSADERLDVRIGIQSGPVKLEDGDYFGTPVVVAKRLCDAAAAGEILTTSLVIELLSDNNAAEIGPARSVELKGIEDPVVVRTVVWSEHGPRRLPLDLVAQRATAFVGRDVELTEVEAAWQRAQGGEGQVVLLAGEPGIGKTALAVRVAEQAWQQGAVVLFGRCDEESVVAFQPWVESLAAYVGTTRPATLRTQLGAQAADLALLLPELALQLPELGHVVGTGADTERYRIVAAVAALVAAIAEEAPVVLILDDLHWADAPTLQLLRQVIRATTTTAVMVLGAYRDTDLVRTHPLAEMLVELRRGELVHRVPMRGLSEDDVRDLLGGAASGSEFAHALWHETEGSPLFLREILRHLTETGVVVRDEDGVLRPTKRIAQLGIPEGVREVIGRRLTRLSEAANVALRAGSVLGRETRLDVLERITGLSTDQVLDAMDEAVAAGIVDELPGLGRWSFTHALVRQGLYDELSLTRRVRLHQQVAEALEAIEGGDDGPHLAQLAFHFTQAAVAGGAEKAIAYARRAGEYATSLAAHEEAARHYEMALEVAEDVGQTNDVRIDLLFAKAHAEWKATADDHRPQTTLERALLLLDPDDAERLTQLAVLYSGRAHRWLRLVLGGRSLELLDLALAKLPETDSPLRARALAALAQVLYFEEDPTDRSRWASDESVAMARRLGDRRLLAEVLTGRGIPFYDFEHGAQALIDNVREALEIAEALADDELRLEALGVLCLGLNIVNDNRGRGRIFDEWTRLADVLQEPNARLLGACTRAGFACAEGRFAEAERLFLEAFAIGQETRNPAAFIFMGPGMGAVRLLQGRVIEMIGTTSEYIDFFPNSHSMMYGILSLAYAECGMPDEARQFLAATDFRDPVSFPRRAQGLYGLHPPARSAFLLDDADAARPIYEMTLPLAGMISGFGPANYGAFDYGLGLAAAAMRDWDAADRHFADAHEIHDGNGWRAIATECRWFHAAMLERSGRPGDADRAAELARGVVAIGEELGMQGRVRDARDLLGRLSGDHAQAHTPVRARAVVRLRDRAKAKLSVRGRAAAAGWSRGKTDVELARRFEGSVAQRGLFGGMARAFQPAMAFGFEGDLEFELRPLDDDGEPEASDWWTIEIRGSKASARRGRSEAPTATIHAGISDFVRIASGETAATYALLKGTVTVDGDVIAISRLPDLFGMIEPLDGAELPAT